MAGYSATISWYLIGSFTRGRHYDSDGLLRAEWPSSGHWEVTPMAWMTMHWTVSLFFANNFQSILMLHKHTQTLYLLAQHIGKNG
jgi:hypothetical protein